MDRQDLMQSFERQVCFIREQLMGGKHDNAIKSIELLATYMTVRLHGFGEDVNNE